MKIIQFLPTLAFGDAVGNDTRALGKAICEMGFDTHIYAEAVDSRLPKGTADDLCAGMPDISENDIIIYHLSTGSKLNYSLENYKCRKMMVYHNITPPHFFDGYNMTAMSNAQYGLDGMKHLSDKFDYCTADSDFNRQDLINAGYKCPVDVRPILIPFEDYETKPDSGIIKKFSDGWTNIIFVGRIAPNKKQQDIISSFCYYKKNINPRSRLIFVGSYNGMERYYNRLLDYVKALELDDVIFTGHIKFPEILAYYRIADIFLCMSEHEGFCVPLVEAMYFEVPVIAYKSCAVPYTLGGSGILTDNKNPIEIAMLIDRIVNDKSLRDFIISGQKKRLEDFSYEKIKNIFEKQLKNFIAGGVSK